MLIRTTELIKYRGGGYFTLYNSNTNKSRWLQFHWQTPDYIITLSLKYVPFINVSFVLMGYVTTVADFGWGGDLTPTPPYQYRIYMYFLLFCTSSTIIIIHCKNQLSICFCSWDIMQCHVLWWTCHILWQPLVGGMV